ncbi:Egg protein, partial [Schistosoma japonicum]
ENIVEDIAIYNNVFPGFSIFIGSLITSLPQTRCKAQTNEDKCTAKSRRHANCTWRKGCGK